MKRIASAIALSVNFSICSPYLVTLQGYVDRSTTSYIPINSELNYQTIIDTDRQGEFTDGFDTHLIEERDGYRGYFYWDLISNRYLDIPSPEWISNAGFSWDHSIPTNYYNPTLSDDPITSVAHSFWLGRNSNVAYGYFPALIRFDQDNTFMWENWAGNFTPPENSELGLPILQMGPEGWIPEKLFFNVYERDCVSWGGSYCSEQNSDFHGRLVVKNTESIPEPSNIYLMLTGLLLFPLFSILKRRCSRFFGVVYLLAILLIYNHRVFY